MLVFVFSALGNKINVFANFQETKVPLDFDSVIRIESEDSSYLSPGLDSPVEGSHQLGDTEGMCPAATCVVCTRSSMQYNYQFNFI